jgi:DNA-binding response OmpR family regulator
VQTLLISARCICAEWLDVVVLDANLAVGSGLESFRRIHAAHPKIPVIFITGHGTTATAIKAMRQGAYEYLLNPLELDQLTDLASRAFEISRLMRVPAVLPEGPQPEEESDAVGGHCAADANSSGPEPAGKPRPVSVTRIVSQRPGPLLQRKGAEPEPARSRPVEACRRCSQETARGGPCAPES